MAFDDAAILSLLGQILSGEVDGTMSANILAKLQQNPDIQAEAEALFGQTPTSIGELAKNISMYLLPNQDVQGAEHTFA